MAHPRGNLVVCGDAGADLGDSIYEAKLFVRGSVKSLGADCIKKKMKPKHIERLRALQWVGLACAFGAVAFTLREGFTRPGAGASWPGDVLGLVAGVLWGLTTVVIRATALARVSAEKALFYSVAVSAVALPLLSLALGERWDGHWSAFAATSVALQTVVGAFASYLAWTWLVVRYPATKVSAFVFLTPIFALAAGEHFHLFLALFTLGAGQHLRNATDDRQTAGFFQLGRCGKTGL